MHFYVYVFHCGPKNYYWYERTCGTEQGAKDRVTELQRRGQKALYLVDHLIRGAFY
jgi:hypothetical protein